MSFSVKYKCGCFLEGKIIPPLKCPVHDEAAVFFEEKEKIKKPVDDGKKDYHLRNAY